MPGGIGSSGGGTDDATEEGLEYGSSDSALRLLLDVVEDEAGDSPEEDEDLSS